MNRSEFTAVIFDLDGTLIEIDNVKEHADNVLLRTLSRFGVTETTFKDRYKFFFSGIGFLDMLEKWGIRNEDQKRSFIKALSREECDEKRMLIKQGSIRLYRDASILDALQGKVKLGLVSNSSSRAASLELDYFNIRRHFNSIVTLGDFANRLAPKPDPDGILHCLRILDEPSSKTIVVGDNLTDVIAGEKSGAHTALILRGSQAPDGRRKATLRIEFRLRALAELEDIVLTQSVKNQTQTDMK